MGRIEVEILPDTLHSIFAFFRKMRLENIEWRVSGSLSTSILPVEFSYIILFHTMTLLPFSNNQIFGFGQIYIYIYTVLV